MHFQSLYILTNILADKKLSYKTIKKKEWRFKKKSNDQKSIYTIVTK